MGLKTKSLRMTGAVAAVAAVNIACAQPAQQRVSPRLHPNLAAAQDHVQQAYDRLNDAQFANYHDLGGHAKRAKQLLAEANAEIKAAAIAANNR
ncbi:hypothetical protein OOT46_28595 [Aquabacterium sp. A7-Y]|uniref:hypothetical protein n=1 Tax=Aquabacterium sp. A7-Y TaxID=1349605 RepID=UPI00223D6E5E|nr:hypothetical protein [Aquabacterium sp. A7-Y]MCW7541761.1 hypothetical protein [Aquabacterium sp. A7-Y]